VLYVALGFGFLAKGPVAILVPLLTLILYRLFLRKPIHWRHLRMLPGALVVLGMVAVWGIPALVITQGAFWEVGIQKHVVQRGVQAFNNRMYLPVLFYPVSALFSLFPWIAFFGVIWQKMRSDWTPRDRFLAAWFLAPILIFSFYATQLPHYIMPGFPAFMLLAGHTLAGSSVCWNRWPRIAYVMIIALHSVLALLLFVLAACWPFPVLSELRPAILGMGMVILALVGLALAWPRATRGLTLMALAIIACGSTLLGTGLRAVHPAVRMQQAMQSHDDGYPFAAYRYTEPSLVFYSARHLTMLHGREELLAWAHARASGTGAMLLTLDREAKLTRLFGRTPDDLLRVARDFELETAFLADLGAKRLMVTDGLNTGRGSWVQLSLWHIPEAATTAETEAEGKPEQDSDTGSGEDIRSIM